MFPHPLCSTEFATTAGEGSTAVTDCICTAGHFGEIEDTESVCEVCALGTYKGIDGPGVCTDCPGVGVSTAATASTLVTECLCIAGYFGEILTAADECTICEIGTYKEGLGIAEACEVCPTSATTPEAGSAAVTDCLCVAGFTGLIEEPTSTCDACEDATYKEVVGPDECLPCTENADTATTGSDSISSCRCLAGYGREGDITEPEDTCDACPVDEYKAQPANVPCAPCPEGEGTGGSLAATGCQLIDEGLSVGAVVGITTAAVVGVGAAFGGVMYGKSNYNSYKRGGRRASVNQNNPNNPTESLMPSHS
eukprot:SAG22_NODE_191_length_15699_cov_19.660192_10_plen_310_part_00